MVLHEIIVLHRFEGVFNRMQQKFILEVYEVNALQNRLIQFLRGRKYKHNAQKFCEQMKTDKQINLTHDLYKSIVSVLLKNFHTFLSIILYVKRI